VTDQRETFKIAVALSPRSPGLPGILRRATEGTQFSRFWIIGDVKILNNPLLGLLCSIRCPGRVIVQTYDLARALRDAEVPVIGGFHSPMEKECLDFLLRGKQSVIVCPARSITNMRMPLAWRKACGEGRLLILSPFAPKHGRISAPLAGKRNRFVSLLADQFFVPYAAPGSKTEHLCQDLLQAGKKIYTFESEKERDIVKAGAVPIAIDRFVTRYAAQINIKESL
jgi:predicted Rossmann fold nucleotide-binding protein DprA/Smf involved in DNA uptake